MHMIHTNFVYMYMYIDDMCISYTYVYDTY